MKKIFNTKKIVTLVLSIILVLTVMSSTTYALFFKVHTMENIENYTSGILDIVMVEGNKLELNGALPISDAEGSIGTPYTLAIINRGNLTYSFDLKLLSTTLSNQINANYIKIKINDKDPIKLSSLNEGILESDLSLSAGQTMTITLRIWLSIDTPNTEIGKNFSAQVVTDGVASNVNAIQPNYCDINNITNFKECLIRSDSYTDYDTAIQNIDNRTSELDLDNINTIEPINYYASTKKEYNYDIDSNSNMATSTISSFTYVEESKLMHYDDNVSLSNIEFNMETGYYVYKNSKTGSIDDIVTTEEDIKNGKYKYTCLNTISNGNCQNLYVVYSYKYNNNRYEFKSGIKYTYQILGSLSSNSGLFKTIDEYTKDLDGDGEYDSNFTYFYRGDVKNNWVEYAGNLWRIVRINGNGSIRMIYSGSAEEGSSHTGKYASIPNSNQEYYSTFSTKNNNLINNFGSSYVGYMYNPQLTLATTPSYEVSSSKNLNSFINYNGFSSINKYYFFDEFSLNSNCNVNEGICTMVCTNFNSSTGTGDNCIYSSWNDLSNNSNNYNANGVGSTNSDYLYVGNYKYTCWGNGTTTSNGTTITVKCPVVSEALGVRINNGEVSQRNNLRVRYHGLFSANYESSISNISNSNIKTEIDNWYVNNILNKYDVSGISFSDYLSDEVFCNDRSIVSGNGYNFDLGHESTAYGGGDRTNRTKSPTLICNQTSDSFTVSSDKGNGKLEYPIALITVDEVVLAGGILGSMNYNYYLYTGESYWTMSPADFNADTASSRIWLVLSNGYLTAYSLGNTLGIRPVVNLSSDVIYKSGTGTETDPYKVTLN